MVVFFIIASKNPNLKKFFTTITSKYNAGVFTVLKVLTRKQQKKFIYCKTVSKFNNLCGLVMFYSRPPPHKKPSCISYIV